jgi:hypothetical protein
MSQCCCPLTLLWVFEAPNVICAVEEPRPHHRACEARCHDVIVMRFPQPGTRGTW